MVALAAAILLVGCPGDQTERAARSGDPVAQYELAMRLEKSDPAESSRLLLLSAAKGITAAQLRLGKSLLEQKPTRAGNAEKGFFWIRKAAAGGNLAAQQFLPICHLRGLGTPVDRAQAIATLRTPLGDLEPSVCAELAGAMDQKTPRPLRSAVLEMGVSKGSNDCAVLLAKHLSQGPDADKDAIRIRELLEKAVAAKHPGALLMLGQRTLRGIGMPPKPNKGIDLLIQAAEAGEHAAACELFWPLNSTRFSRKDPDLAFRFIRKAYEARQPGSSGLLARCYIFGMGAKKDEAKGVEALRNGAATDDPECLEWLGVILLNGSLGQTKSVAEAAVTLDKAAKLGAVDAYPRLFEACKELGDNRRARAALEEGAALGNLESRVYLGMAHCYGSIGVEVDAARGLSHYLIAAEAGDLFAKYLAAELMIAGKDVPKDLTKGVQYLKSAAAGNIYAAQHLLAMLFSKGVGVPQDASQAYFWANLAASLNADNEEYGKYRDTLARKLSSAELAKVQGQCRSWLSRKNSEDGSKEESGGNGGSGSGIIFTADGLVLTNHHVVAAGKVYTVMTSDGQETPATLVAVDEDLDVAVLRLRTRFTSDTFRTPPPLISSAKARSGEKVFTVGHPLAGLLSNEAKYNEGTISALSGMKDDQHLMQISVPIQPGNSGGPLANSRGEVIGLIVSTINGGALLRQRDIMAQNVNFAIKSDPIQDFLRSNSIAVPVYPAPKDPVEHVKAFAVKVLVTP